ncbi:unnamed protein product [Arabidopsis arenosa]|uniref:Replication protein A 70 kDa DNA-binding subunit B/D first OB fold domain-containing protein n=1 Tax=Arabidopsis arenosa TaxID=38785 RepID=A0A8S2A1L6_ARAAE|nr:unnamed protein product [Arabidopsis arenosa]
MNNFLTDLTLEKKEWFVVVKILSIWNHPPKHPNDHTTMILVDNKCLAFPRINNPSEEDKQFVVVGVVRSVSPIGRLLEGGSDLDSSYVTFKLKDLAGHSINCVAKGSFCEEFVRKYSRRISDVNYHNQPIMVVLRFWRISEFGGKPCLITKGGCPRMFIDENFADINRDCYICFFTAGNKETASSDNDNVSDEEGHLLCFLIHGFCLLASLLQHLKGQRIDATVPTIAIKRNFPRELREGQWYLLSEFDVIPPSLPERNSDHFYQISCNRNTEVDPVRPKSQSDFFNCVDFFSINNASEEDKQYVVDVCGVVVSVSPVGRLLEGGSDMDSRYVTFTLKDTIGHYLNCVAKGNFCEEFVRKYSRRISDVDYHNEPIMIVLRFWRISLFQGKPCLITGVGCPRIFFDPNFHDINRQKFMKCYTQGNGEFTPSDDDDVFMEEVDSN